MSDGKKLKQFPVHLTDEEAERFVEEADLSEYDFSGFKTVKFEFLKKDARLEVRLPEDQLAALKDAAKNEGLPTTRLVRRFIDDGMQALAAKKQRDSV